MTISVTKFDGAFQQCKQNCNQLKNNLAQLKTSVDDAIKIYAYSLKNPDNNNATEIVTHFDAHMNEQITVFNNIAAKMADIEAVKAGTMTADDMIPKYAVDLAKISSELL